MINRSSLLCIGIAALLAAPASGQVPDDFVLYQNDPNPFCNVSGGDVTEFSFYCPEEAFVLFRVLASDTTSVLVELVSEILAPGYHSLLWNGQDGEGEPLPYGDYPYVMAAFVDRPPVFDFADTLIATIACIVPVDDISWGSVKSLYLRPESVEPD